MCENLNEVELAKFCDRSRPRDALIIQFYFLFTLWPLRVSLISPYNFTPGENKEN